MPNLTLANNIITAGFGALAAIALFSPLPAAANEYSEQVRVNYTDLDLTSEAGQETLNKRIRGAVSRVCGPVQISAAGYLQRRSCMQDALAGAQSQMRIAVARASERKASTTSLALASPR